MGYNWGPTQSPIPGFIVPPPFPPVYGAFNLTSYLQGASDYEVMCSLLSVVKGVYDYVATLGETLEKELKDKINEEIAAFETKWNTTFSEFIDEYQKNQEDFIATYEKKQENFIATYEKNQADFIATYEKNQRDFLAQYSEDIQTLINNINAAIATVNAANKNYTDTEIAKIKEYVDSIDKDITNVMMLNPFTGTITTLQQILNDFSDYVYKDGFTVGEYANVGFTVEQYANKEWTVWDYAYGGKQLLGLTGLKVLAPWNNNAVIGLQDAINYLYSLHEGSN